MRMRWGVLVQTFPLTEGVRGVFALIAKRQAVPGRSPRACFFSRSKQNQNHLRLLVACPTFMDEKSG